MIEADDLLEPVKTYKSFIKSAHRQNCEEYFDNLVKQGKVDVELNRSTNKNIKALNAKIEKLQKSIGGKKALKTVLIFLAVIGFIGCILLIVLGIKGNEDKLLKILLGVGCALLGVILLIIVKTKVTPKIKNLSEEIAKITAERDAEIAKAREQMAGLNALFDWNIAATLFTKTIPLIQLDPYFDEAKYQMLHEKYDFNGNPEKNISSVFVQSGSILGNPFVIEKNYVQEMHDVPYSGSITIHWTTSYTDSEGHRQTQHHTQTLTATIYKPAPYYYYDTMLVYGNDVAERLSFTRSPSDANKMNDKQLQKFIDGYDKKLDKLTENAIKKGKSFQRLGNNEFEALFNALDRDDNVQFRLLFSPLAQRNMCALIKSREPYGDDFHFIKRKCLNYIKSDHSQNTNFEDDPSIFMFYDIDVSKQFFLDYNEKFMQSLFFDLAPIMCIPLYQQHASQEYIYKGTLKRNVSEMDTEVMANSYNASDFKSPESVTNTILKTEFVSKNGEADLNKVIAYGFKTVSHTEYVKKLGGDGIWHNIPVQWFEYIPVSRTSEIIVQNCKTTKKKYDNNYRNGAFNEFLSQFSGNNAMIYKKGFISFLNGKMGSSYDGNELNKIFAKGDK